MYRGCMDSYTCPLFSFPEGEKSTNVEEERGREVEGERGKREIWRAMKEGDSPCLVLVRASEHLGAIPFSVHWVGSVPALWWGGEKGMKTEYRGTSGQAGGCSGGLGLMRGCQGDTANAPRCQKTYSANCVSAIVLTLFRALYAYAKPHTPRLRLPSEPDRS